MRWLIGEKAACRIEILLQNVAFEKFRMCSVLITQSLVTELSFKIGSPAISEQQLQIKRGRTRSI